MKWEYTYLYIEDFKQRIEIGVKDSNWELVAIYEGIAYFKRPCLEDDAEFTGKNFD
jgi:hypothetical protein